MIVINIYLQVIEKAQAITLYDRPARLEVHGIGQCDSESNLARSEILASLDGADFAAHADVY